MVWWKCTWNETEITPPWAPLEFSSKLEIDKQIFKDSFREYNQMTKQTKQRYLSSQFEGRNSK